MYLSSADVQAAESRWGVPLQARLEHAIQSGELELIRRSATRRGRAHDLTLYIFRGAELALIRKPGYAEGLWRPPSGGCHPGEDLEEGALREGYEETGLRLRLERYLTRLETTFRCGRESEPWVTHVLALRAAGGRLEPRDRSEVDGARWGTLDELNGPLRERMLATGRSLFAYRVKVHDLTAQALAALEEEQV